MPITRIENATVWTGDRILASDGVDVVDAVAFAGDQVLAVGSAAWALPADHVVDAGGAFVCPAFGDGHAHPILGGLQGQLAPVHEAVDSRGIVAAVGAWAAAHPDVEWVRGEGFDQTLAPGGVFRAAWLDDVVPDRPVVLRASDFHTAWVNSEALRRVGYTSQTPDPPDGEILRDPTGSPVGTLREWGAWRPVYDLMSPMSETQGILALRQASERFSSAGVTWVQDAWVEARDVDMWMAADAAEALTFRADLALWCDPGSWRDQFIHFVQARERVTGSESGRLTATTVKFFADGVIESGTGALLEPYCDCPHSRGLPNWDAEELARAVTAVDALGFDPHVHAIGDAAIRTALDAIESAIATNARRDRRPVVAHAQLVDPADLERFARLGVIVNFEPYWAAFDATQSELTAPRLGPDRTARQYPIRTMIRTGAPVSFGSDWPVSTHAPLAAMQVAATRGIGPGDAWIPQERITIEQALSAYTAGTAYQARDPRAGVLREGSRADIVMLACDPRSVGPMSVSSIEVLGTWLGGHRVHDAGGPSEARGGA